MTIEKITEILVSKGVSLETANWVETWIRHFVEEAEKRNIAEYEVDFAGLVKAKIMTSKNDLSVKAAMNGYGDLLDINRINIQRIDKFPNTLKEIDDKAMPKFGVDDKVRVCDSIDTVINDIEWDGTNKCWKYFFTDPTTGKQSYEWEGAIELI